MVPACWCPVLPSSSLPLAKSLGFASGVTLGLSFSLGGIIVPSLGWYADSYGIAAVMLVILAISICCAAATFLLPEPKKA